MTTGDLWQINPLALTVYGYKILGYWDLNRMAKQTRSGEYWLSRFKSGTTLWTKTGEPFDRNSWLMDLSAQGIEQTERWLDLGTRVELKARLMVQKMPPEVANRRRAALKQRQKAKGKQPSQRELARCDWTLLVTNVPEELLCADEALILYAARWQIELLFNLWKSQAQLAQSRSNKPWRRLGEIYCNLIGVLVPHWISLAGTWQNPRRSLVMAAQVVTSHAKLIALALSGNGSLLKALRTTISAMHTGCSQNSRRQRPNTWLTLLYYLTPWGLS